MEKVANLSVLHTGTNYTIITTWYREEWCIRVIDGGNKVRYKALPAVTIEAALMEMLVFVSRMLQSKYARERKGMSSLRRDAARVSRGPILALRTDVQYCWAAIILGSTGEGIYSTLSISFSLDTALRIMLQLLGQEIGAKVGE